MRLFGYEIARRQPAQVEKAQALSSVNSNSGGWFTILREGAGGWFQSNITADAPKELLAFSAVFGCVTGISSDIAKLGATLLNDTGGKGIYLPAPATSPYQTILKKPNPYQTWYKFIEQWIVSKLLNGATFIVKQRDARGIVSALYILDANRVTPLVAENGDIYYQCAKDYLSRMPEPLTIPAAEIIHDTMVSLWHPLIGVTPIYACGISATMGNRILTNSTKFFANMSRPSGQLTAPGVISDEVANRLKQTFEENFSAGNIGRLMVGGDGLKYEPMAMSADDAQLIEQLKWTVADVARCFHFPMYKLGGEIPAKESVEALNQTYYSDCLQSLIESAESLLDEGLGLPPGYHVEFNLENLLRMDTATRYKTKGQAVKDGWMAPNEARAGENLPPVTGGDTVYLQQQNYSLEALAKRDASDDPFGKSTPAPGQPGASTTPPKPGDNTPAPDAANDPVADDQVAAAAAAVYRKDITWLRIAP